MEYSKDELYIQGDQVAWSQNGQIQHVYDFTEDRQPVIQALWIQMKVETSLKKPTISRTLCVILQDIAHFIYQDGRPSDIIVLPFLDTRPGQLVHTGLFSKGYR